VLLTSGSLLAWIVINGLVKQLGPLTVIEEQPERKVDIIKRRAKRLGWLTAFGQTGFGVLQLALSPLQRRRLVTIWRETGLDPSVDPKVTVHRVSTVNSPECLALLAQLQPAVVAVYGTRILKQATLDAVQAQFINYHAGINPKYRGQHPAYWALSQGDREHAGVTIHLVDNGVDTGEVLRQATVAFKPEDRIYTYQHRQAAVGLPLFAEAIAEAADAGARGEKLPGYRVNLASKHWYPPTLWGYLTTGLRTRIW
jgi:folate-dependent phosphoribosylglycinamide formyltransferase PurN